MPSYPRYREAQTNLAETDYSRHILAPLPFSPANSAIGLYSDGPETSALQDSRHSGKPALSDNRPVPYPGLPDSPITYPYSNLNKPIPGVRINSRIRILVPRFRIFSSNSRNTPLLSGHRNHGFLSIRSTTHPSLYRMVINLFYTLFGVP